MAVVVRRLGERTVEAIRATMARELESGKVQLFGKRVTNTVRFSGYIRNPARFVGDLGTANPEYARTLNELAKKITAELIRQERLARLQQLVG